MVVFDYNSLPGYHWMIMVQQTLKLRASSLKSGSMNISHRLILPAIILAGAAIRIFQIGRESLWYDELYTVWASSLPLDIMVREVPASGHPMLYYLVAHAWYNLGSGEAWFRMISWAAGVLTIWLVYLFGKELISRQAGLWAAAFAALSPYLVWYSRDATDYSWLMAVSTLSLYFLVRSVRRGGWVNWSLYVLASVAALFSHYYAAILLVAEVVLFLFIMDGNRRQLKPWLCSQAALALVVLPWALMNRGVSSWAVLVAPTQQTFDALIFSPVLFARGYAGSIGSGAAAIIPSHWERVGSFLVWLMIIGFAVFFRKARRFFGGKLGLALALCTAILIVVPIIASSPFVAGRYLAAAAPLFLVLVALILTTAPRRVGSLAGTLVLIGLSGLTVSQMLWTHNDDWRGIMQIISAESQPGDSTLCFPLHHYAMAEAVYLSESIPLKGGIVVSYDHAQVRLQLQPGWHGYLDSYGGDDNMPLYTGEALKDALSDRLADTNGVWLVAGTGELGQYPAPDAIEAAMINEWKPVGSWDFSPLALKHYVRRDA